MNKPRKRKNINEVFKLLEKVIVQIKGRDGMALTAFLLSRPRKKRSVVLTGALSDKHLASHISTLGT